MSIEWMYYKREIFSLIKQDAIDDAQVPGIIRLLTLTVLVTLKRHHFTNFSEK
jgi:hypothetical protein